MTYPRQKPGQSLDQHQAEMARWMGVSVETMNRAHDPLHRALCAMLDLPSQSMRQAAGEDMTAKDYHLASLEEQAVLNVQRFMHQAGGKLP